MQKRKVQSIVEVLQKKVRESGNDGLHMKALGNMKSSAFALDSMGEGLKVKQLGDFVLEWSHFQKIIKKANALGGKMYRGDELAQKGATLGDEISYDCMEGFIASELLNAEEGSFVTRRSTYYSGILAWAGIISLHKSEGKGSYIMVTPAYRDF